MTHAKALPRNAAQTDGRTARYTPRSLSIHSWRRFRRYRHHEYVGQIDGGPSPWQVAAIASLIRREWLTITAERTGDADAALRADREYVKLLSDFRRSIAAPPNPRVPTLAEHFARKAAEKRAAEKRAAEKRAAEKRAAA